MPGPDLLVRYLNAYLHARQMSDAERPWGLGDDSLDALWTRLMEAAAEDAQKLNQLISEQLTDGDRAHIIETLAPLIFALPLRTYPAELRGVRVGPRLILTLRHLEPHAPPAKTEHCENGCDHVAGRKSRDVKDKDALEYVGHLPAGLTAAFAAYLRLVLNFPEEKKSNIVTISSGGRRRRVRVTILAHERGIVVRFLERVHSPADSAA